MVGIDENIETPAHKLNDSVDYVPMNKYKAFLIHFLNIAGLGPIFGAIQGALFGPSAFLWIVFGTIFAGAVHDFFSGFLSVRLDGLSLPGLISEYLGEPIRKLLAILTIITLILLTATFTTGSATLIYSLTNIPTLALIIIIFAYLLIASLFPTDKVIGKIYPLFRILFLLMSILMIGGLLLSNNYAIPEFTTANLYFSKYPIFPFLFITIHVAQFLDSIQANPQLLQDVLIMKKI
ncbi:MAG: hypothetical protein MJ203_00810 [archaeon]|nr:hypothetical protein [archaeon]